MNTRGYIVGATLIILVIMAIILTVFKQKSASLKLSYFPNDATVYADGDSQGSAKSLSLSAGPHSIIIKRSGFADSINQVDLKAGQTKALSAALLPNSPEGFAWLQQHPDQQLQREAIGGQAFDQNSGNAAEKYPLITKLPIYHRDYKIDYGSSQKHSGAIAIYITAAGTIQRQEALDRIRSEGYDPSDYEIIFRTP